MIICKGVEHMLDQEAIKAIIPHREPFILIDEIDEIIDGQQAKGR